MKNDLLIKIFFIVLLIISVYFIISGLTSSDNSSPSSDEILEETLNLSTYTLNMEVGEEKKVEATVLPDNASNKEVTWISGNNGIVTVDNGMVKAINPGRTIIKVSTNKRQITKVINVTVNNKTIDVTSINVANPNIELYVGDRSKIDYTINPSDATNKKISFVTSDKNIAGFDKEGNIVGLKAGNATITLKSNNGKEASINVKVKNKEIPVEKVTLSKTKVTVSEGGSVNVTAKISPKNATNKEITWTSSDNNIAKVDNGKITGVKKGTATIKATVGGKNDEVKVTVSSKDSFGAYEHVFIIGIDGLGAAYNKVSSPNFDKIFGNYAYRHDAKTEYITISAQNWGSILTGVAYDKHGFTNSSIKENTRGSNSANLSIFYYVRKAMPNAKLVSIVNWDPINHGIIESDINVNKIHQGSDDAVMNKTIEYIKANKDVKLLFVHFDEVDGAAHAHGGFSNEYYDAVKKSDERLGKIYNTINSLGLMNNSLFILVADHGETSSGHGGQTKEESSAVLAVRGHTVNKVTLNANARNRDVAAIALHALGIKIPSHFTASVPANLFGNERN